jgi:hypothetical protein
MLIDYRLRRATASARSAVSILRAHVIVVNKLKVISGPTCSVVSHSVGNSFLN